jgi:superfamily II DNA/RNA helicase
VKVCNTIATRAGNHPPIVRRLFPLSSLKLNSSYTLGCLVPSLRIHCRRGPHSEPAVLPEYQMDALENEQVDIAALCATFLALSLPHPSAVWGENRAATPSDGFQSQNDLRTEVSNHPPSATEREQGTGDVSDANQPRALNSRDVSIASKREALSCDPPGGPDEPPAGSDGVYSQDNINSSLTVTSSESHDTGVVTDRISYGVRHAGRIREQDLSNSAGIVLRDIDASDREHVVERTRFERHLERHPLTISSNEQVDWKAPVPDSMSTQYKTVLPHVRDQLSDQESPAVESSCSTHNRDDIVGDTSTNSRLRYSHAKLRALNFQSRDQSRTKLTDGGDLCRAERFSRSNLEPRAILPRTSLVDDWASLRTAPVIGNATIRSRKPSLNGAQEARPIGVPAAVEAQDRATELSRQKDVLESCASHNGSRHMHCAEEKQQSCPKHASKHRMKPDAVTPRNERCTCELRLRYTRDDLMRLRPAGGVCPSSLVERSIYRLMCFPPPLPLSTGSGRAVPVPPRTEDVTLAGPDSLASFEDLRLSPQLLAGLQSSGFLSPSPVQMQGIPLGRLGVDLVAQAKSGTGKTIVFCVVALELVLAMGQESGKVSALILAPTRDIAAQTQAVLERLAAGFDLRPSVGLFIGGTSVREDERMIREQMPCIAVGTPGRVDDLICRGVLDVSALKLLVLDEADRLLDGTFGGSVPAICRMLPPRKQVVAFSATYPTQLLQQLKLVMRDAQFVNLYENAERCSRSQNEQVEVPGERKSDGWPALASTNARKEPMSWRGAVLHGVRQAKLLVPCEKAGDSDAMGDDGQILSDADASLSRKLLYLRALLSAQAFGQAVVFLNDRAGGMWVKEQLCSWGFAAVYTSGQERQSARRSAIEAMRRGSARVLVSTDVVARGVDLPGCDLVVHLDVPRAAATYLHRVGRAGRFGARGVSVLLHAGWSEARCVEHLERELRLGFSDAFGLVSGALPSVEQQGDGGSAGTVPTIDKVDVCVDGDRQRQRQRLRQRQTSGSGGPREESMMHFHQVGRGEQMILVAPVEAAVAEGDGFAWTASPDDVASCEAAAAAAAAAAGAGSSSADVRSSSPQRSPAAAAAAEAEAADHHRFDWDGYARVAYEAGAAEGYARAVHLLGSMRARLGPGAFSSIPSSSSSLMGVESCVGK